MISLIASTPPSCFPGCGQNAHCEYGQKNRCVCNEGTSGNPYEVCGAQERTCSGTQCGKVIIRKRVFEFS